MKKKYISTDTRIFTHISVIIIECKERPERDADPSTPSSAVGHERVELYLYSPYGQYGLYRTSVPVQRCTLTLLLISKNFEKRLIFLLTREYSRTFQSSSLNVFTFFFCTFLYLHACYISSPLIKISFTVETTTLNRAQPANPRRILFPLNPVPVNIFPDISVTTTDCLTWVTIC